MTIDPTRREPDLELHSQVRGERALFRRLADGLLSADEFHALEERLASDPSFRDRYVDAMQMEAGLYEAINEPGTEEVRPAKAPGPIISRRTGWRALAGAAVAVLVFIAVTNWNRRSPTASQYLEAQLRGLTPAAVVIHGDPLTTQRDGLRVGSRLKPGVLTMAAGELELEFFSGARVVLEGPCELHILSEKAATLISGRAAARVRDAGRGFVLNAPDAAIVDLGTEFAVGVDGVGQSEVQVIDGEVEVNVLGDDGNTLSSERLVESGAVRVSPSTAGLEAVQDRRTDLPKVEPRPRPALPIPKDYVESVLKLRPVIYWRFESVVDGTVLNEAGPRWSGRLQTGANPESLQVRDGVATLLGQPSPRFLTTDWPLTGLNTDSFSIELWVNPDHLHNATLVGIAPDVETPGESKLNVLELAHRTQFVHAPGTFRFLHRDPPSRRGGVNLFAPDGCTPGQWHHVVAVKTPAQLRLYLNGERVRTIDEPVGRDDRQYRLIVGQLHRSTVERQFLGAIDELAVYLSELSDADVALHFQLAMTGKKPLKNPAGARRK